jgi:hypothetical protein
MYYFFNSFIHWQQANIRLVLAQLIAAAFASGKCFLPGWIVRHKERYAGKIV